MNDLSSMPKGLPVRRTQTGVEQPEDIEQSDCFDLDLGVCCGRDCRAPARNVLFLDRRSPLPGRGWGCIVCDLSSDGAIAVLCDPCMMDYVEEDAGVLRRACRGYPVSDGRVFVEDLVGTHEHDREKHVDDFDDYGAGS